MRDSPTPLPYRKVSLVRRLPLGVISGVFLAVVFVGLPWFIIPIVTSHGIQVASNYVVLATLGSIFAVFEGARVVMKPTRWYGPLWIVSSAAFLSYLLYLSAGAAITLTFISNLYIQVGYAVLLLLFSIVPAMTLVASVITTLEDIRYPGERLPFDFRPRRKDRKRLAQEALAVPPP